MGGNGLQPCVSAGLKCTTLCLITKILSNLQKEHENLLRLVKQEAHWMQHGVTARRKRNERGKAVSSRRVFSVKSKYCFKAPIL